MFDVFYIALDNTFQQCFTRKKYCDEVKVNKSLQSLFGHEGLKTVTISVL